MLPPILSLFSKIILAYCYAFLKSLLSSLNKLNPCYTGETFQVGFEKQIFAGIKKQILFIITCLEILNSLSL